MEAIHGTRLNKFSYNTKVKMNKVGDVLLAPLKLGRAQSSNMRSVIKNVIGLPELIHFAIVYAMFYYLLDHDLLKALLHTLTEFGVLMLVGMVIGGNTSSSGGGGGASKSAASYMPPPPPFAPPVAPSAPPAVAPKNTKLGGWFGGWK